MCTLPLRFIKERNKVSTASPYCHEHRRWQSTESMKLENKGISK